VGNFVIELNDEGILVTQIPGSGRAVSYYSGKNHLNLVREISAASPVIKTEHIGYLGVELQKAAQCLKTQTTYSKSI
jgi:thymidylate synthase